jgi:hypothetical protein
LSQYAVLTNQNKGGKMMIKLIYAASLLILIAAGAVFMFCGTLCSQDAHRSGGNSETSIVERFQTHGSLKGRDSQAVVSPLVKQATAYALHLTPPAPKARKVAARVTNSVRSVHRPVGTAPKFRLLATTYYRSSPEKSLALVSEPGKGDHWVKKDERLGHFVVESVEKGSIVCRDGAKLHEVKVPVKKTVQLAKTEPGKLMPTQAIKPNLRLLNASQSTDVE